jgi:hypothetical protein
MRHSNMRNHISAVLLMLAVAVLVCDIVIRSRPVHAQSSPTVYSDQFSTLNSMGKPLPVRGRDIVAFSFVDQSCYVLSNSAIRLICGSARSYT